MRPASVLPCFAIASAILLLLSAHPLHAQTSHAAAEALFRSGREAIGAGDYTGALAKLRESYRLEASVGTLLNIAVCEEQLGSLADAWRHYQEVVHATAASDSRAVVAAKKLEALERRLPRLTITVEASSGAAPPADLRVRIGDGIELAAASFGVPLPINPGQYVVVVSAAGHQDVQLRVTLREGDRVQLPVHLGAATASTAAATGGSATRTSPSAPGTTPNTTSAAPSPGAELDAHAGDNAHASAALRPADAAESSSASVVPYVCFGAASVALLSAAVTGVLAFERTTVVDDECERSVCSDRGFGAGAQGRAYLGVSLVSLAVGVVAAATGTVLLLSASDAEPAAAVEIRSQGLGLAATTRF